MPPESEVLESAPTASGVSGFQDLNALKEVFQDFGMNQEGTWQGNWGDLLSQQELFQDKVSHCIPNFLPLWELKKTQSGLVPTDSDIPESSGGAGTFRGAG